MIIFFINFVLMSLSLTLFFMRFSNASIADSEQVFISWVIDKVAIADSEQVFIPWVIDKVACLLESDNVLPCHQTIRV